MSFIINISPLGTITMYSFTLGVFLLISAASGQYTHRYAKCIFDGTTGEKSDPAVAREVKGTVIFKELSEGTLVTVDLRGFTAQDIGYRHGFHVHEGNGTGNECNDAKGHLNPDKVDHGHPQDKVRHVGDMGNIEVIPGGENGGGIVKEEFVDPVLRLEDGKYSVINRVIQLHANQDDYGRTDAEESKSNGNSGPRQACCKILSITAEEAGEETVNTANIIKATQWILLTLTLSYLIL